MGSIQHPGALLSFELQLLILGSYPFCHREPVLILKLPLFELESTGDIVNFGVCCQLDDAILRFSFQSHILKHETSNKRSIKQIYFQSGSKSFTLQSIKQIKFRSSIYWKISFSQVQNNKCDILHQILSTFARVISLALEVSL